MTCANKCPIFLSKDQKQTKKTPVVPRTLSWYSMVHFCLNFSLKSTKLNVQHGTLLLEVVQKSTMLNAAAKVQQINSRSFTVARVPNYMKNFYKIRVQKYCIQRIYTMTISKKIVTKKDELKKIHKNLHICNIFCTFVPEFGRKYQNK